MAAPSLHTYAADSSFDGGELDCGSGLLLLIRKHIDPLPRGGLLEILSSEVSVKEDLPAWCRLTGNELVSIAAAGGRATSFLVCKGAFGERAGPSSAEVRIPVPSAETSQHVSTDRKPTRPTPAPAIPTLAVMGIGSWPRPRWMIQAVHEHVEGRLSEGEFQATADDAVRLCVEAQRRAGVDVLTDGEQRRDSYASFVGGRLDNCQLIPLTDLLPLVDDPEAFQQELRALDVPAREIRHPAVLGPLRRSRPIAAHEAAFLRTLSEQPVKVALPGPYLLTRTMWMECISDNAYASRVHIAQDIVRVLREELTELLAAGVSLVQFDEPVLSEVVFSGARKQRSFMCGALSEKGDAATELALARDLVNAVVDGFPRERVAIHVCRGNWTPDESACLAGSYAPLVPILGQIKVGTYFLELCTPRAGDIEVLRGLPEDRRIGVGVADQKQASVESRYDVAARTERAIALFGLDRVLLNPDCGFATFADNPVTSAATAEGKLAVISAAARDVRDRHGVGR
ncbi:MAG TPA: 5-methyltetrahydropteroyltriglutamate--homocysteine methyltransferase [Burkholderiales bacterium]|nr:5-methyltetrahydropteroyltriglutamate--homocysteine methyltransferase [Burkholderiales bacterium]